MHKYGNMFRAADCANDTLANKVRTIDLRLTLGSSPAHADMLTWNPADTAEAASARFNDVRGSADFGKTVPSSRVSQCDDEKLA